jgi:hypothetical protein
LPINSNSRTRLGGTRHRSQSPYSEALRRYEKIAPLVTFLSKNRVASLEDLLAVAAIGRSVSSATLRRWLNSYLKLGLSGLEPATRSDLGVSRAFRSRLLATILVAQMHQEGKNPYAIWRELTQHWASLYPESNAPAYNTVLRYLRSIFPTEARP